MLPLNPSREALAVLRDWLTELESKVADESTAKETQSAEEREDRAIAAAWASRHRSHVRQQRSGQRNKPSTSRRKAT